ncbi:expressed unknown protein [Seminavis robusta]|uniref:Uncharacterized protein n=1 Tax=Seminavis robusta TaxID=568900 RepID=A0A9N8HYA3_9STRA|nr:expressed unknown protein [Seminavis robusta]|eukprot:Sro1959_g307930.1 n/a (184) ;mRNA; r:4842-5393
MKLPLRLAVTLVAWHAAMALDDLEYKLTSSLYMPDADHQEICREYFGSGAEVADFEDFKAMDPDTVQEIMSELSIGTSRNEHIYFLKYQGQSLYPGTPRHAYFFENNGGDPPAFVDMVDHHGGLNVGVTNKFGRVVCRVTPTIAERVLVEIQEIGEQIRQTVNNAVTDTYSVRRRLVNHEPRR